MIDSNICLQGIGTHFNKPILHGDRVIALTSGCFDKSLKINDVSLLWNHDISTVYGTTGNRLEIHAGNKSLAFRFTFPFDTAETLNDIADDLNSYRGVSIGYSIVKSEVIKIDGFDVTFVREAKLHEISLLSGTPAVDGTYVHVVKQDSCADLKYEHDRGLLEVRGRFFSIHRKLMNDETGEGTYSHTSTPLDIAANNFIRSLERLA